MDRAKKPWVLLNAPAHTGGWGWSVKERSSHFEVRPNGYRYDSWREADAAWSRVKTKVRSLHLRLTHVKED